MSVIIFPPFKILLDTDSSSISHVVFCFYMSEGT